VLSVKKYHQMKSFILIFSLKIVGAFSNMEVGEQPIEKVESFEKLNIAIVFVEVLS